MSQPQMDIGGLMGMLGSGFFDRRLSDNFFGQMNPEDINLDLEEL